MNSQELATCFTEHLPVKTVIINNGGHGMVRQWQRIIYKERFCSIDLPQIPDLVKLAEAYGCVGLRVTKPSEVVPAIEKMLSTPAPVILDVIVDKDECVFPMVPAGGANNDMILAPPSRETPREGGEVTDGFLDEQQRRRARASTRSRCWSRTSSASCRGWPGSSRPAATTSRACRWGRRWTRRVSRMTIVVRGDEFVIEQVIKQLHKLIDVIKVNDLTEDSHVERELVLIRVNAEPQHRAEVLRTADIFRAQGDRRDAGVVHAGGHR